MDYDLVANHILGLSSARVPRRRRDLAITVLLLLESGALRGPAYRSLGKRGYQLDHRFVVDLLESARVTKMQWAIVRSPAFWRLPGRLYRHHFFRLWRLHRRSDSWRWVLGRSLHPFLMNNSPQEGPAYAKIIWTLASDPIDEIALAGLSNTKFLGLALTEKQAKVLVALTHQEPMRADAALSNLGSMYQNLEGLRPEVRALLLAPTTVATLRGATPPDWRNRWSSYRWCMTNMRKALAKARPSRHSKAR